MPALRQGTRIRLTQCLCFPPQDGTGADRPASFWDVIPPAVASDDPYLPTFAGTFRFSGNISSPPDQSLAKVPRFWMFRLNEVTTHPPTVGLDNLPESHYETSPLVVGSIVLPYTALLVGDHPMYSQSCSEQQR